MGVQIPVGFAQSSQEFLLSGAPHPFIVTCGHNVPVGATATSIATLVRGYWQSEVWGAVNRGTDWALGKCTVYFRTSPTVVEVGEDATITAGTVAGNTAPPSNSALLVKKVTGLAGRQNRGRMYAPLFMLAEANVSPAGSIDGATLSVIQGWFDDLLSGWGIGEVDPVLLHEDGSLPTPITDLVCQATLATQRRRMRP